MMALVIPIFLFSASVFSLVFSLLSFYEKESRAGMKFLYVTVILVTAGILGSVYDYPAKDILAVLIAVFATVLVILFLIKPGAEKGPHKNPPRNVDEHDIIFSRMKLQPGSTGWRQYYSSHSFEKGQDDIARALPGLLSERSRFHNKFAFVAADASFGIIEYLHKAIRHPASGNKVKFSPEVLTGYIKEWLHYLGAHSTGICELRDYHLYTVRGRGEDAGREVVNTQKYAIAFTVEMDHRNMMSAPLSPTVFESSQQYLRSANMALQAAAFLKKSGWNSRAHIDGDYEVICPLVARDAGLGEIGRMGLLITPSLGPRVRIAVVTTDAPLITDYVQNDHSVTDFCRICSKCAGGCPANCIPAGEMEVFDNVERWKINSDLCYRYWCTAGTDCGRCISVCPFSHPDNMMHRIIRRFIRRSAIMRKVALAADNFFYGEKPVPKDIPSWMNPQ